MKHIPVLKNEVMDAFSGKMTGGIFVDGTLGAGNHSIALASQLKAKGIEFKVVGIDKDATALKIAEKNIKDAGLYDNFILINDDFKNIKQILADQEISTISGALLDLGVSSMQLDQKDRGFSFADPTAKLDMRMNQDQKLDAAEVLNYYPESRLETILREYGEEKFSRQIARDICFSRKNKRIETVGDLIYILEKSIPLKIQKTSRVHFATKTFQAVRIEVNGELIDLEQTIRNFVDLLDKGGRLAIITFHSLEDRIVKNTFKDLSSECSCPSNAPICTCNKKPTVKLINKKPIIAAEEEIDVNPRSRSAKLRIIEKI